MRKRLSLFTLIRWCTAASMALGLAAASLASPQADALRAKQAALSDQLAHNAFHRPLHLESTQNAGDLQGDIVAIVDHPFRIIDGALMFQFVDGEIDCVVLVTQPTEPFPNLCFGQLTAGEHAEGGDIR